MGSFLGSQILKEFPKEERKILFSVISEDMHLRLMNTVVGRQVLV